MHPQPLFLPSLPQSDSTPCSPTPRGQRLARNIQQLRASHRPCRHLARNVSIVNARRAQQEWAYARSVEVTRKLQESGLSGLMQDLVGATYDRIGRFIFAQRGGGTTLQKPLYAHLCAGSGAMSRDKRYRHIRILEQLDLVSRHSGMVHLHDYLRSNPSAESAAVRHESRRLQKRAADTRYKTRICRMRKTSAAQKVQSYSALTEMAITPITNRERFATAEQARAIARSHPMFATLHPASVVTAKVQVKALDHAVSHLMSSPQGVLRNPCGALIDRAKRMSRETASLKSFKSERLLCNSTPQLEPVYHRDYP